MIEGTVFYSFPSGVISIKPVYAPTLHEEDDMLDIRDAASCDGLNKYREHHGKGGDELRVDCHGDRDISAIVGSSNIQRTAQ